MAAILIISIKHSFNLTSDITRSSRIMVEIVFFMVMTSAMTSQGDPKIALYIHVYERLASRVVRAISRQ